LAQKREHLQDIALKDLRAHPELVTDLLSGAEDVSVVLQRRGDTVRLSAMKTYSADAVRIASEARAEHAVAQRPEGVATDGPGR
jgi:hypothetical protein